MKTVYLEGGRIVTAHGVRGLVKVESWCNTSQTLAKQKRVFLKSADGGFEERKVTSASVMGELALMGIEGIDSREMASAMKNQLIYLHRDDIPLKDGEMFIADIIGLPVFHVDTGERLGTVADLSDAVRGRIYTISTDKGDVLMPAVPEFIKEVDTDRGVFVRPIPGFFEEA
jgi:16S rRNA processing protein RimM